MDSNTLRLLDAEAARRSFYEFVRQAWPLVEPASAFQDNWHIAAICEHLQAVTDGGIRHLLINIPPGHAKSLLVSVLWPAWVWTHRPMWRGIFSSYADDLVTRDATNSRNLMMQPWYQEAFILGRKRGAPLWEFSPDSNRKDMFTNTVTGRRISVSVGSKATGFRGNCVVVDDPLNAKEAPSKLKRDEVIYWWTKVMPTRVDDPARDAFVIIMQRLHVEDLSGFVLQTGLYEHLCLPSEFVGSRRSVTYVRQGDHKEELFRDPRSLDGELLFPERFPQHVLDKFKHPVDGLGADGYAGQHGQRPTLDGGGMFKTEWWRFWTYAGTKPGTAVRPPGCYQGPAVTLPEKFNQVIISLDASFKDGPTNDWNVFTVWGVLGAARYLLEVFRGKWDFVAQKKALRELRARWPKARKWLIEDKANGSAIVSDLRAEVPGLIAVNPEGGKEARASAMQPACEALQVYLPDGAAWVADYVAEFNDFPRGKHDDQVDSSSQALVYLATDTDAARARAMVANL